MRSKALRQERASVVAQARAHVDKPVPSAEDYAAFDAAMQRADTLKTQIDALERADALDAELGAVIEARAERTGESRGEAADAVAHEKRLVVAMLRGPAASREDREAVAQRFGTIENAAGAGTAAAGGYTIAPEFSRELLIAMKAQGGMREAADVIETKTGADLPWPTMDDTAQEATIIGENTSVGTDADLVFGQTKLGGFTYKSGVLLVSVALLQDSAFDFDKVIRDAMAGRFARGQNKHFTNGTGTGQPRGLLLDAPVGKTGAAGQTTSVTYDDLVDLEHSVDPVYRRGAAWQMHDDTVRVIKKFKDAQGRPIWAAGDISKGAPDTLLGYPIVTNQDMPKMAAGAKSIAFGNFKSYKIRDVLGLQMLVLRERYADFLQVGYIAYARADGKLTSAAQPVKTYQNSAT